MPPFEFSNRRYNTLRLLGYDYNSTSKLCAISLVTDLRRPLFADVKMAKSVLKCLLSDQTLDYLRLRAFTLMPDHLHLLAGVREAEKKLPNLIGFIKSYTTQQYWKRSSEIAQTGRVILPSTYVTKSTLEEARPLLSFAGMARDIETGSRGIEELAKCKARTLPPKTSLANAIIRSCYP